MHHVETYHISLILQTDSVIENLPISAEDSHSGGICSHHHVNPEDCSCSTPPVNPGQLQYITPFLIPRRDFGIVMVRLNTPRVQALGSCSAAWVFFKPAMSNSLTFLPPRSGSWLLHWWRRKLVSKKRNPHYLPSDAISDNDDATLWSSLPLDVA